MRIVILIALLVFANTAGATPLEISSGDALLYRPGDSNLGLMGDGWSVSYFAQGGRGGDGSSQRVSFTWQEARAVTPATRAVAPEEV